MHNLAAGLPESGVGVCVWGQMGGLYGPLPPDKHWNPNVGAIKHCRRATAKRNLALCKGRFATAHIHFFFFFWFTFCFKNRLMNSHLNVNLGPTSNFQLLHWNSRQTNPACRVGPSTGKTANAAGRQSGPPKKTKTEQKKKTGLCNGLRCNSCRWDKKGHRQKRKTSEVIHQHSMTQTATVFCESKKNKKIKIHWKKKRKLNMLPEAWLQLVFAYYRQQAGESLWTNYKQQITAG